MCWSVKSPTCGGFRPGQFGNGSIIFDDLWHVVFRGADFSISSGRLDADPSADIRELRLSIQRLTETPHIGTLRSDIYPGIRFLRRDKAAVWFLPIVDRETIIVAAIFFGAISDT